MLWIESDCVPLLSAFTLNSAAPALQLETHTVCRRVEPRQEKQTQKKGRHPKRQTITALQTSMIWKEGVGAFDLLSAALLKLVHDFLSEICG